MGRTTIAQGCLSEAGEARRVESTRKNARETRACADRPEGGSTIHPIDAEDRARSRTAAPEARSPRPRCSRLCKKPPDAQWPAVISLNDDTALEAMCAARELGPEGDVAIVGAGADQTARKEIRHPELCLFGSSAYWPEKHSERLIQGTTRFFHGEPVPPVVINAHVLVTQGDIDEFHAESRTAEGV